MSLEATEWAMRKRNIPPREFCVLLAIANSTMPLDDEWIYTGGLGRLASWTHLSEQEVEFSLLALAAGGYLRSLSPGRDPLIITLNIPPLPEELR